MVEQSHSGQLVDYSGEVISQPNVNEDYIQIDLNDRPKVGFLYKNGPEERESLDMGASNVGASNLDFSSKIRKNSKVLFSNNEPDEENNQEVVCTPAIPADYSVATILEQNDFAVSDVFELARELKRTYLFKILIMGDSNTGKWRFELSLMNYECRSISLSSPNVLSYFALSFHRQNELREKVHLQQHTSPLHANG